MLAPPKRSCLILHILGQCNCENQEFTEIHWNSSLKVNFDEGNVKGELTDRWFGSGFQLMSSSSFPKQLSVANKFTLLICNVQWMSPIICLYLSFTLNCLFAAQVKVLTLSLTASAYCIALSFREGLKNPNDGFRPLRDGGGYIPDIYHQPQFEAGKFYSWKWVNSRQQVPHDKTA